MIKRTLQELCLNITDGKHGDCENEENSGYYFISCKDIFDGQINYKNARQITKADFEETHKRTMLEVDDILLTNSGTIGRMAFVTDREATTKTTFQKSVAIIKPDKQKVLPRYLYYQLQNCVPQFINSSNGSAQKNLLLSTMRTFQIEIEENREKQEKIANTLSAYDDLIENNQKQIKLLEEAAQRLYKEWFVDLRFPGHENTKIADGVPERWNEKTLSQVADVIMGQSPKSEFYNSEKKGLPFHQGVGSYGVRFVMDDIYSTSYTRIAEPNSILFSVRAPVGRLNITKNKVVIGRGLAAINQADGCQSYLYYLLKNRFFKDNIVGNGSIFASVSKDELLNQKFLIPERNLMMQFEKIVSKMDKQIENLDSKNKKLIEARDRLLPKLMSGEVEV